MHPEILRVHNIAVSIKDVGLEYYVDRLIQNDIGEYHYIECVEGWLDIDSGFERTKINYNVDGKTESIKWSYRVVKVPTHLAYFIIDCLKLKSMVINTGNSNYGNGPHGGKLQVIIPAGKEIFGNRFDVSKEIPAELGPVVVERL